MITATFIEKLSEKTPRGAYYSLYRCKCGELFKCVAAHINNGSTKSCGCRKYEYYKEFVEANKTRPHPLKGKPGTMLKSEPGRSYKRSLAMYKSSAKRRGLSFNLSLEQVTDLITKRCVHCNRAPYKAHNLRERTITGYSTPINGIDRKNSKEGYYLENCQTCCTDCNLMKSDHTEQEFKEHVRRMFRHMFPEEIKQP